MKKAKSEGRVFLKSLVTLLLTGIILISCKTTSGSLSTRENQAVDIKIPLKIQEAYKPVSGEIRVMGSSELHPMLIDHSISIGIANALVQLSRMLNSIALTKMQMTTISTAINPDIVHSYRTEVALILSKANLTGYSIVEQDFHSGRYWVVISYDHNSAAEKINQSFNDAMSKVEGMRAAEEIKIMKEEIEIYLESN